MHASEGTVHVLSPFVLKAAAQGLANLPMQVILTTGGNREPEELDLGPIAPNVRVVRWVSHTELLPHLDVMITTGGSATVQSTLRAGVPLIVVPTEWDKPDIARRVVETGAGIRLAPENVRRQRLRAAVEQVLRTPSFRQNAQRMAAAFARYGGPSAAADLLEAMAGSQAIRISPVCITSTAFRHSVDTLAGNVNVKPFSDFELERSVIVSSEAVRS